ncbi:hypothetical protein Goarm_020718, partial [Gossypium armourianum]|nr:hypothetical protein [Gossypium armourianum]
MNLKSFFTANLKNSCTNGLSAFVSGGTSGASNSSCLPCKADICLGYSRDTMLYPCSLSGFIISGHDGGTGASPISSIKHAGGPWELGLTETHQTLIENGLRERVILRVDGGFRSGVDVLMAAAMGADEYGFGSLAMIATGCVMARICHTNNCPVGVASQREELRARFPGVPGDLVNFFLYVAEEVRGMLAQLGYEKLDDIIGRTDLLKPRDISLVKTQHLDLNYILSNVGLPKWSSTAIRTQEVHSNGPVLDEILLSDPE